MGDTLPLSGVEKAEHVVERAVLQHQQHDVVDRLEAGWRRSELSLFVHLLVRALDWLRTKGE